MKVKIKSNFSEAIMESFYRFHFTKISQYRIIEFSLIIMSLIVMIIGIIFNNTYVFAIALVFPIIIVLTRKSRIRSIARKIIKKNPPKGKMYEITITDNNVTYIHEDNITDVLISDLKIICENDMYFYLYITDSAALIIPKYYIKANEKEMLRELFIKTNKFKQYKFTSSYEGEGTITL